MIEDHIKSRLQEREILLMTHIVIGYPSLDASLQIVSAMVEAGVDLMELQIPFSEPMADGPVILRANQVALEQGISVNDCLMFAESVCSRFSIPFLFMSYANIPYQYGLRDFTAVMKQVGIQGAIIPDLPIEEGTEYLAAMQDADLSPIMLFAPNTSAERMKRLARQSRGFVYCVARKGVTGRETAFSSELEAYLARCRQATGLPLAVGFGVKESRDVRFLSGKADIAVIGSQTIRLVDEQGIGAVSSFFRDLRMNP